MNVKIVPNQLMNSLKNFVIKTLTSLALTEDEFSTYKKTDMNIIRIIRH